MAECVPLPPPTTKKRREDVGPRGVVRPEYFPPAPRKQRAHHLLRRTHPTICGKNLSRSLQRSSQVPLDRLELLSLLRRREARRQAGPLRPRRPPDPVHV